MSFFITADEHYGHTNILKYCNRPFPSIDEMDEELIKRNNEIVKPSDIVLHAGDFSLKDAKYVYKMAGRLNGNHIFLKGSHDYWLPKKHLTIYERNIDGNYIVVCHYAMRTWARSHYNSWQFFGHSHGRLEGIGKQMDIGVDTNNFYPYEFSELVEIMKHKPNNPNYLGDRND